MMTSSFRLRLRELLLPDRRGLASGDAGAPGAGLELRPGLGLHTGPWPPLPQPLRPGRGQYVVTCYRKMFEQKVVKITVYNVSDKFFAAVFWITYFSSNSYNLTKY